MDCILTRNLGALPGKWGEDGDSEGGMNGYGDLQATTLSLDDP